MNKINNINMTMEIFRYIRKTIILGLSIFMIGCSSENKVSYITAKAEKQNLSTSITATGTIEPVTKVEVGTQVSGIISKIYVDYNSYVHKGDILAELDRTNLNSELVSAESNLASAVSSLNYQNRSVESSSRNVDYSNNSLELSKKDLELSNKDLELSRKNLDLASKNVEYAKNDVSIAQSNYSRYSTLFQRGLISANDYEQAQQSLNNAQQSLNNAIQSFNQAQQSYNSTLTSNNKAKESVNQAMEALNQARLSYDQSLSQSEQSGQQVEVQRQNVAKANTNLGYATITSPIDGVVLSKEVEEGQTVAAAMTTPTLFILAQDLTDMRVIAKVDEADIGGVKEGQRVTFTVDAFPDDVFEGGVTQVRQEATTESNVVTYEVVISAPNDELKLKPGLTANVTIYTMEKYDVLTIPSKALRFSPNEALLLDGEKIEDCNSDKKVWIFKDNVFKAIPVETGSTNGTLTEITSGLKSGDEILTEFNIEQESEEVQQENNNPFMPKRPGSNRTKKDDSGNTSGNSGGSDSQTGGNGGAGRSQ